MKNALTICIVSPRVERHSILLEDGCIEVTLHVIYRLRHQSKIEFLITIEIVQEAFIDNDSEDITRKST